MGEILLFPDCFRSLSEVAGGRKVIYIYGLVSRYALVTTGHQFRRHHEKSLVRRLIGFMFFSLPLLFLPIVSVPYNTVLRRFAGSPARI